MRTVIGGTGKALVTQVKEFDALVVRSATAVTREVIESGVRGKLKIVGRAGVGFDNIDVTAATENGVVVKSAPYGNTNAAAELSLTLMLAVSKECSVWGQFSETRRLAKEGF